MKKAVFISILVSTLLYLPLLGGCSSGGASPNSSSSSKTGTGPNVKAEDLSKGSTLEAAVQNNDMDLVKMCLEAGADPNFAYDQGNTCLMTAASNGNDDILRALITAGANINDENEGYTALICGVDADSEEVVQSLITAGADVNYLNYEYDTALIRASRTGNPDIMRLLLDAGAEVNVVSRKGNGETPLGNAEHYNHPEAAALLRQHGAKPLFEELPETGIMASYFFCPTTSEFQITAPPDQHVFIMMESNTFSHMNAALIFVRAGETADIMVESFPYTVKYAVGKEWQGLYKLFGQDTQYAQLDESLHFQENEGLSLDIMPANGGNISSREIDRANF